METIRFGGRAVTGFGLGDATPPPMTVQDAAKVSQSWIWPTLIGGGSAVGGLVIGAYAGHEAGRFARGEAQSEAWLGGGMLAGLAVGGALGGAIASGYGRKQERAAAVLAQAVQVPQLPTVLPPSGA